MPRTKKDRLIQRAPCFYGFKPQGIQGKIGNEVCINFEEYEALNLCDYELLTQVEAAKLMNISRPTFTRIYESVRRKIARAFIEGTNIRFEGGNVSLAEWFKCDYCKITFTIAENAVIGCPFCKSTNVRLNN